LVIKNKTTEDAQTLKIMVTKKLSLDNMQGKLSRAEMKNVMGGVAAPAGDCTTSCNVWNSTTMSYKKTKCTYALGSCGCPDATGTACK
jgi:hypothetical protein